jgi:type IV pilus assembly protein PilW
MMKLHRNRNQAGFSLVELMVAVAIGAFLMLVIMSMFASTSRSRALQTALSGLNESGRFALSMLSRDLRMAGYRETNWMSGSLADTIIVTSGAPADGGDSIVIQYEGTKDCTYADAAGGTVVNTYALNTDDFTLECNNQALVDGVEEMQIYLGEDITGDGVANRMMAPNDAGLDMARVVSMRIHLLVRSDNQRESIGTPDYFFDDATHTATDTRLRREYAMTIALRNPT